MTTKTSLGREKKEEREQRHREKGRAKRAG
jgi:hypothetical protein